MSHTNLRVLVLPPTKADGLAMGKVFAANDLEYTICANVAHACSDIDAGAGTLIIAEEALLATPEEIVACVAAQPVWSDLPVIVLSRSGRESSALMELVVRLGNVSVVERPVRTSTLISLIRASLRARERQYQVREYIKKQEEAQAAIREGERRYRSLIENVADYAIFMTDADGRISSWNGGAEAILGYSAGEVLGRPVEIFASAEDCESRAPREELDEARRTGRSTSAGWRVGADGRRLYIECVTAAVKDDTGRFLGAAHFWRDATERHRIETEREQLLDSERAARHEAERAGRTKDEFLATLGHELRTPLNAVLGWTQVLRMVGNLPAEVTKGLTVIERNARAQAQIMEDLLDMSSIISGKVHISVQGVDLASVVRATVETVRPTAEAKGVRLDLSTDRRSSTVMGDPNRLQQVFWNLLTNAVKFTPQHGFVSVKLKHVGPYVQIEVADNGEGIDPAFLPHVFDRFRQADPTTARRHGGLGLGLSIVKQLVELHGGSIAAESAGRGAGSTFRVTLPIMTTATQASESPRSTDPRRAGALPAATDIPRRDLEGLKILVVDDEPDARALVQRVLQDCNASVVTASSVDEALDALMRDPPDVLISDIGMPRQDGYELIRRLRSSDGAGARVPAIALTAYARTEDRRRAIQAGFQAHLSKPVEAVALIAAVENLGKSLVE